MSGIRVRRHTDGRVALLLEQRWHILASGISSEPAYHHETSIEPSGEGWSELFVAQLPEPEAGYDGAWIRSDDAEITAEADGISVDGEDPADPRTVTADALKMLAAVAASEQNRAQQEASDE